MIRIRLAQISQRINQSYYLPYSVGLLQAYALAHGPPDIQFAPPLSQRLLIPQALEAFKDQDLAGFSVYVWNIQRSLKIAEAIKQTQPETLIVFGGPQVPDQAEDFMRQNPFVDLCVHGAGEEVFCRILEAFETKNWQEIPGLSWFGANGEFQHTAPASRSKDLSHYPSPFLSGVFDPLLQEYPYWYTALETNRGCPFSCTFCDWGSAIASKVVRFPEERLWAEIEWMGQHHIKSVFCADANFGILPRDLEIARQIAKVKQQYGFPEAFQIQTAKNVSGRVVEIQRILTRAGLSASAAISLQSLHTDTLKNIKRENISLEAYRQIQQECLADGIFSYTDIIMGLPGESYQSFVQGIESVICSGQYNKLILHDATILPNAEMAQPDYRRRFGIETASVCVPGHSVPEDGIPELMEIVIATDSLPRQDWVQMHVYAWMVAFVFYTHKLLQFPMMLLHQQLKCSYQSLIELLMHCPQEAYPILNRIKAAFEVSAQQQQRGYPFSSQDSYVLTPSEGTYLTPDLTMQIALAQEGLIDDFYLECLLLLSDFVQKTDPIFSLDLLNQSLYLSRYYFLQVFQKQNFPINGLKYNASAVTLSYNLPDYYQAMLENREHALLQIEPRIFQLPV